MTNITDYSILLQSMFGRNRATSTSMLSGTFQFSQLNSSYVQSQLKAAGIDTNSKQYKAVINQMSKGCKGNAYTNVQAIKNLMKQFDGDGDYINVHGVAGMLVNGIPESERHQIINIPDEAKESMYKETMRHYIQENGVANGDTTKRSEVYTECQLSLPKEDRLKGTWTLQQYETAYRQAFYDAIKSVDPNWELGKDFDAGILRKLSREDIDNSLVKSGNQLFYPRKTIDYKV